MDRLHCIVLNYLTYLTSYLDWIELMHRTTARLFSYSTVKSGIDSNDLVT